MIDQTKNILKFFSIVRPYTYHELTLFFLIALGSVSTLFSPYALKVIIDDVIPSKDITYLYQILLFLVGIYIFRFIVSLCTDALNSWLSNAITKDIKQRAFSNLLNRPMRFFDENKTGELIHIINSEVHRVQDFITNSIIRFVTNLLTLIGLSIMLLLLNPQLFLVSIIVVPIAIAVTKYFSASIRTWIERSRKSEGHVYNFLFERIKNIKLVKSYHTNHREEATLNRHLSGVAHSYQRTSFLSSVSANVSLFFISLGPVTVFAMGGHQLLAGTMSIGALVAFIQYLNRIYTPMNDLILLYSDYVKASVSMKRIGPFLFEPQIQSNHDAQFDTVNSITLRNLNFSYHEHSLLLNNINFDFVKGKSYAIVGNSGSGKSSLINLLTKFYQPDSGQVLINGHIDLNNISPSAWNSHLTSCHQDALILNESIADNLRYGNQTATDQQLKQALAEVNFLDHINTLPSGLETLIGDGSQSVILSGGQQQQLALARTILKDSSVLTLDESTSSLDSINDHLILSGMIRRNAGRMIICVSHRLSTIRYFDEIVVLRNGRIVESGSLDNLLATQGVFCEIFQNQIAKMEKRSPVNMTTE